MRPAIAVLMLAAVVGHSQEEAPLFRTSSNLVVVTVFAKDKKGNAVAGLKKEDFLLLENGKPQAISAFEFQRLSSEPLSGTGPLPGVVPGAGAAGVVPREGRQRFRDRRLLVLFYDWSGLDKADQIRALEAGREFIEKKLTPSDLVALVNYNTRVNVLQEFTGDKDLLLAAMKKLLPGVEDEFALEDENAEAGEDAAFTADLREFNLFNTDRKLVGLEEVARHFAALPEKKAVVYFSGGKGKTGPENESQLRATINSAVRSNVSYYPIDVRGLEAYAPAGDASEGMKKGSDVFSGAAQTKTKKEKADARDTLYALASDTGGKALFDNNQLTDGLVQAQQDLQSYYILGYYSPDDRRDGRFRRIEVKLARDNGVTLDFRRGYYAQKDFKQYSAAERDRQLEDALLAGDPVTDLPLALEVDWFRLKNGKWFVPVAVKIPGSAVPVGKKDSARVDFIGQVKDERGALASAVRDTIEIKTVAGRLASRSLLYDTGFTLGPGRYRLKMLVRENGAGKMGTFETSFAIPEDAKDDLLLSAVVLSSQRVPASSAVAQAGRLGKEAKLHPLVRDGQKILPSVTRVFRPGQTLTLFAEVYPASTVGWAATASFFRGGRRVLQTKPVVAAGNRILIETALAGLTPGEYTVQVNVVDAQRQRFAFGRSAMVIAR